MGPSRLLVFRARERLCALPLACTVETMRPLPVEPVAGTPPFVLGLSIVRGTAVPVVDAGALLAGAGSPRFTRFVVVRLGERRAALAVEEVLGPSEIRADTLAELPP